MKRITTIFLDPHWESVLAALADTLWIGLTASLIVYWLLKRVRGANLRC